MQLSKFSVLRREKEFPLGENDILVETTASLPKTVNISQTVQKTTQEIYEELVSSRDYHSREAILYWNRKYNALLDVNNSYGE